MLGGDAAIEVRFAQHVIGLQIANGESQLVREFQLAFLELGPLFGYLQLGVAHARHLAAEAQGHIQLEAHLPLLELAAGQSTVSVGIRRQQLREGIGIKRTGTVQLVAHAQPLILSQEVEPGQEEVLGGH